MADLDAPYPCDNGYCTADAVFYVSATLYGDSPRVVIIGGVRARELLAPPSPARYASALCTDCTSQVVEDAGRALVAAAHVRVPA